MTGSDGFLDELQVLLEPRNVITDPDDLEPFIVDVNGYRHGDALCVAKPASTDEVVAVVKLCGRHGIALVPQGGNTGFSGGGSPIAGHRSIVLRLDRMNRMHEVNALNNSILVEAGCVLADVQAAADAAERLFPLSLGAEGTCQIGGNIGANAGGLNVLRYGMCRDLVLGLEVVLADGSVFNDLRGLRKNNAGYPLSQLFIGSEGTFGIVTQAVLKLVPKPRVMATALAALDSVDTAVELLTKLRAELGDRLNAFEIMSHSFVNAVHELQPALPMPLGTGHRWYLLIEVSDMLKGIDLSGPLTEVLAQALEAGMIGAATIAASEQQRADFWRLRHGASEIPRLGTAFGYDTSVSIDREAVFVEAVEREVKRAYADARLFFFGHIGDGNIHCIVVFVAGATVAPTAFAAIGEIVDSIVLSLGGSISAEHGIGLTNKARFAASAASVNIEMMRKLKSVLDPGNLLNPGKVI